MEKFCGEMTPSNSHRFSANTEAPAQVGSRHDGLVSVVTKFGVNVVLGDARAGRGHEGGNWFRWLAGFPSLKW